MTLNEIYRHARANRQTDVCRFMRDMRRAGLRLRAYNGRSFYRGPAVSIESDSELQDIIRATRVKLQWDSLGRGSIVYPVESLRGVERV
jgi:hypothetical protein